MSENLPSLQSEPQVSEIAQLYGALFIILRNAVPYLVTLAIQGGSTISGLVSPEKRAVAAFKYLALLTAFANAVGEPACAEEFSSQNVALYRQFPEIYFEQGKMLAALAKITDIEEIFNELQRLRKVYKLLPTHTDAIRFLMQLAEIARMLEHFKIALTNLHFAQWLQRKYKTSRLDRRDVQYALACVYEKMASFDKATEFYRAALDNSREPEFEGNCHLQLAACYIELGKGQSARMQISIVEHKWPQRQQWQPQLQELKQAFERQFGKY